MSGKGSVITCDVFPPLDLSRGEWEIGVVDFTTYNSIPNVEEGVNNNITIGTTSVNFPTGSYEIDDIRDYIEKCIKDKKLDYEFKLKANTNTLKVEMFATTSIDFTANTSLAHLLGFSKRTLEADKWHESDLPVDINKVNVVRVECNVARGTYDNGLEGHIIHEFYPAVPPGYKIVETPRNVIYVPVNVKQLQSLSVSIVDQNNRLINLRGETVNLRLHLRDGSRV